MFLWWLVQVQHGLVCMSVENKDPNTELYDYKGLFWDDVNKRFYRWYELKLLMQEREIKAKQHDTK